MEKPIEFLKTELETLIKKYTTDRNRHKRNALYVKIWIANLSAGAIILLGWKSAEFQDLLKNMALVLNAVITILVAYEAFFEPRKLWVRETIILSRLKDIERDLKFDLAMEAELPNERLLTYKARLNDAFSAGLEEWVKEKSKT